VWDNAEISFSDEVEARIKRYPTTPTTWLLLRDFEAQVSEDDDVDWVLHVASVVSRLIKPFFASTVFSAALYARERADLLALVRYGVVVTSDEGASVHGRNRARHSHSPKRPAQRFGARVLCESCCTFHSTSARVLALHTRQPSDAVGAVERGVVPVVSALLNFMDRNAHRPGLRDRSPANATRGTRRRARSCLVPAPGRACVLVCVYSDLVTNRQGGFGCGSHVGNTIHINLAEPTLSSRLASKQHRPRRFGIASTCTISVTCDISSYRGIGNAAHHSARYSPPLTHRFRDRPNSRTGSRFRNIRFRPVYLTRN
jgi:hypothetical protein